MQHSLAQSRQRQNSLPKATSAMQSQNPGPFMVPGSGALPTPGVKIEPTTGGQRVIASGGPEDQEHKKELETMHTLVNCIQRYAFPYDLSYLSWCCLFSYLQLI